jgi:hypothetical protein
VSHTHSSSLARVLAAPWQQRRNLGSVWGLILVVALCAALPTSLWIWSLLAGPASAEQLHRSARASTWVGAGALLMAGWAMLVGNVLQQNHPTLGHLVPGHVGRLRGALLAAWAMLVLLAAGVPGLAFDAPLAWGCGVAAYLAVFAAALRWPLLWLAGIAAPFLTNWFLDWNGHAALAPWLRAQWRSADGLVTAIVATAGIVILTSMISSGGTAHVASYEARRRLGRALGVHRAGGTSATFANCWRPFGRNLARPYAAWMRHLLARRDSPVMGRLLLGLGPATHWTMRIRDGALFGALAGGLFAAIVGIAAFLLGRDVAVIFPWLAFSLLTGACTPALQAAAQLYRTRREQELLVLLPGVPRGARLNRWLGWQMSVLFVGSALWGFALAAALVAFTEAIAPGVVERSSDGIAAAIPVALLPQVAWQWRTWARLRGASGRELLPSLTPFLLGAAALALHAWAGFGYPAMGVAFAAVTFAWCAWRWHRMGSEPTALPIGRLA